MIIRMKKGSHVSVVDKDGKPVPEHSGPELPKVIDILLNNNYKPEYIFFCNDCQTYTSEMTMDTHHRTHSGHKFRPSPTWFANRMAVVMATKSSEFTAWVEKKTIKDRIQAAQDRIMPTLPSKTEAAQIQQPSTK